MREMMSSPSMWSLGPLMMLFFAALVVIPFWFIFRKAGYSPWLALLMLVPVVNLFMVYFLAFSRWPVERDRATK